MIGSRMKTITLLAALSFLVPAKAVAQNNTMDAENVLRVCTTAEAHWVDFCNGFFQAVHDSASAAGLVCTPSGLTRTDLVELYEREAPRVFASAPVARTQTGALIAAEILRRAYPCQ